MDIKRILKNRAAYFLAIFFLTSLFFAGKVQAATLGINADPATVSVGDIVTLRVIVNSEGVAINNAEATLKFPNDLFDVLSVNKAGSVFSLWVEEPSISNSSGTITFNGGVPTPGFNGSQGAVVSITARAKKAGQGDFAFSSAAVRANDGLGTDVLSSKQGKSITVIKNVEPVVVEPVVTPEPVLGTNFALQITSPTHPNQDSWYGARDVALQWVLPAGVDSIQTGMDNTASGTARVTYTPAISQKTIKDVKDGTWYFKARARKGGLWGKTSTYVIKIDATAPKKNVVSFTFDNEKRALNINADIVDETSGIDHYEIYINNTLQKKVPATEFVSGVYDLPFNTPGEKIVKLVAVDRALNEVEAIGTFHVDDVSGSGTFVSERLMLTIGSFSVPASYAAVGLLLVIVSLSIFAFLIGRRYGARGPKFKVRTSLVKEDNTKVLLVLRESLEKHLESLQQTRHQRMLTKEEKNIKEAVEADLDEVDKALAEQRSE